MQEDFNALSQELGAFAEEMAELEFDFQDLGAPGGQSNQVLPYLEAHGIDVPAGEEGAGFAEELMAIAGGDLSQVPLVVAQLQIQAKRKGREAQNYQALALTLLEMT